MCLFLLIDGCLQSLRTASSCVAEKKLNLGNTADTVFELILIYLYNMYVYYVWQANTWELGTLTKTIIPLPFV